MSRPLRVILSLLILAGLVWYIWSAREPLKAVRGFDQRYLLPMLAVPLASLAVNGLIGRDLVAEFGVRLGVAEWYGLSTVQALGNYLPVPQAGAVARGVYLKRVHALPYSTYATTVIVTYVSSLALSGLVGLAGLAALTAMGRPSPWLLWLIFTGLAASLLMFTPVAKLLPVPKRFAAFDTGLQQLRRHHVLWRIVVSQAALVALTASGLWLACRALPGGQNVNWLTGLMLGLMVMASGVINVTPGNVGVEQGAAELTARLLNVPPGLGFLASSLFRAMAVLVVFVTGPFFGAYLARRPAPLLLVASPSGAPAGGARASSD